MVSLDSTELLFMPPQNIQKMLRGNLNIYSPNWYLFQRQSLEEFEKDIEKNVIGLIGSVSGFYQLPSGVDLPFETNPFLSIFLDGMRNALEHGPQEYSFINYGLFLGARALCQGFQDFGDYFKLPETKKQWESGEKILSTKANPRGPYNCGTSIILRSKDFVDYFEVDNNQGTLFCVQSLEKLGIKPGDFFYEIHKN